MRSLRSVAATLRSRRAPAWAVAATLALAAAGPAGAPHSASADGPARRPAPVSGSAVLAGGDRAARRAPEGGSAAPARAVQIAPGEHQDFWAWDFSLSRDYRLGARRRHASPSIWIYVEDGRDVSDLAIARLARVFEDEIQPALRGALGREPIPGVDGVEALTILLLDVRDDVYHGQAPHRYMSGYFDPVNEVTQAALDAAGSARRSNEREMIFLDVAPTDPEREVLVQTAAHEYAHVIGWNYDPDEATWLNEVIGQLAIHVAGFGPPDGQLEAFLAAPEGSLTAWSGEVADYGRAFAFGLYLYEQLGGAEGRVAARLVQDPRHGVEAVRALLPSGVTPATFLRDFALAIALDLPAARDPRHGFRALALGGGAGSLPRAATHRFEVDRLPSARAPATLPAWSVRLESFESGGAPLAAAVASDGPVCLGGASDGEGEAGRVLDEACLAGGADDTWRATNRAVPDGARWLVVAANGETRPVAIARDVSVVVETQSRPGRLFMPFGSAGSRGRARP